MMAQEEPLYDFPEPSQQSERKFLGHQRSQGSLRSISVLDRLLLTVPVWLQMSINPATALHILQREPPGNFLVRKSRTSQRNVLCVRLADDTVPFFVQQFGIREEQSTLSLETSAISFPDLPRLISFYCVSRDVLPFILELPEAISKATSHKELESISHMGIEFWNSHLNFRGPREAPKKAEEKKQVNPATPAAVQQTDSSPQPDTNSLMKTAAESDPAHKLPGENPTLFHEFCPITTRSPRDLDCGSGQGALCFINPLFLQSPNALCRPHTFKRSFKVRVSTETSTMLSPPLSSPPPPPIMPKRKCKALKQGQVPGQESQNDPVDQGSQPVRPSKARVQPPSASPHVQPEVEEQSQTQREPGPSKAGEEATAQLAAAVDLPPDDSDYMQPSPMTNISRLPIMSHLSPLVSSTTNPLCSKRSPSASPHHSPAASPLCRTKNPCSLSLYDSPTASPCLSPYQSPSPSPKMPFSLSPFNSPSFLMLAEQAYQTPAALSRPDQQRSETEAEEEEEEEASLDQIKNEDDEGLVLQMNAVSLGDTDSCGSVSRGEGAAPHTPHTQPHSPHSPHQHNDGISL